MFTEHSIISKTSSGEANFQ